MSRSLRPNSLMRQTVEREGQIDGKVTVSSATTLWFVVSVKLMFVKERTLTTKRFRQPKQLRLI